MIRPLHGRFECGLHALSDVGDKHTKAEKNHQLSTVPKFDRNAGGDGRYHHSSLVTKTLVVVLSECCPLLDVRNANLSTAAAAVSVAVLPQLCQSLKTVCC